MIEKSAAKLSYILLLVLLRWVVTCAAQTPFEVKDYRAQPLSFLRSNANNHDVNAQFELARRLYLGEGVAQDLMRAELLFRQSAEAGHPLAQLKLGLFYERAIGSPLDHDEAIKWYLRAASQGNPLAQYKLGLFYDNGIEPFTRQTVPNSFKTASAVPADAAKAKDWFSRAAAQGHGPSLYRLSVLDFGRINSFAPTQVPPGSDPQKAMQELIAAANMGVPEAMGSLSAKNNGLMGGKKDMVQAYRWLLLLSPESKGELAPTAFLEKLMTKEEIAEAKKLAAQTVFPTVKPVLLPSLELVHHFNAGPPALAPAGSSNRFQAITAAVDQGSPEAQLNLALCLLHDSYSETENRRMNSGPQFPGGRNVVEAGKSRDVRARELFAQAAAQGQRDAQYHLAWMYKNGRGVDKDPLQARKWFEQAAAQGHYDAKYQLALLMEQGIGGPKLLTEITRLLGEAAAAGHPEAIAKLDILIPGQSKNGVAAKMTKVQTSSSSHVPRLAILALDQQNTSLADLLLSSFSGRKDVEMVERQELDKILKEQAIKAVSASDLNRLGQLLRADGFLLLGNSTVSGRPTLLVRLLATAPGVTVNQWSYPLPLKDADGLGALLLKQAAPLLPKLQVLPQDAIPVSILNLRSVFSSQEAQAMERQITFLLIQRLLASPQIYVLERQKLNQLAEEKQLTAGAEPFWNGSYILDGTINRDGEVAGKVTLHARLVSRSHVTNEVAVTGTAADLPAVVDALAAKLSPYFQGANLERTWSPVEEAAQYFEEGRWANRWGMFTEAQQAFEAAWALGLRTDELQQLRIQSYEKAAATKITGSSFSDNKLVSIAPVPEIAKLDALGRAFELYLAGMPAAAVTNGPAKDAWTDMGIGLLQRSRDLLFHFYLSPAQWGSAKEPLQRLREQVRILVQRFDAQSKTLTGEQRVAVFGLILANNSLWQENSKVAAQELKRYLEQGYISLYIESLDRQVLSFGLWGDWSGVAPELAEQNLSAVIDAQVSQAPPSRQMEISLLHLMLAVNRAEIKRWSIQHADLLLKHRDAVVRGEINCRGWLAFRRFGESGNFPFARSFYDPELLAREKELKPLLDEQAQFFKRKEITGMFVKLKGIFQAGTPLSTQDSSNYSSVEFTAEQAAELLGMFPAYEEKIGKQQAFFISPLKSRLQRIAKK